MDVFKVSEKKPTNSRVVVLQGYERQQPFALACRYVGNRWIGVSGNTDITDCLGDDAIWFESPLQAQDAQPMNQVQ